MTKYGSYVSTLDIDRRRYPQTDRFGGYLRDGVSVLRVFRDVDGQEVRKAFNTKATWVTCDLRQLFVGLQSHRVRGPHGPAVSSSFSGRVGVVLRGGS